jgi:CBS domain containing-hemolysin-like protein
VIVTVIGSNIISILLSTIATFLFLSMYEDASFASLVSTLVSTFLFYIFCDTIPKSLARTFPNEIAIFSAFILQFFDLLFFPLTWFFSIISQFFKRVFKAPPEPLMTEDEFSSIVEKQVQEGTLEEEESELIQSALEFSDTAVKDVFTPIEKMFAISEKAYYQEDLPSILLQSPYSRIPIYRQSIDQIVGVISVRNFFQSYKRNPHFDRKGIMKPPYFISSKINLDNLFEGFKKFHTHLGIVVDQHQKVIGMVTMEDILEEVVGQMGDLPTKRDK